MDCEKILVLGLVLVAAAIIGGGLEAFGIKVPVVNGWRAALLGVFGLIVTAWAIWWCNGNLKDGCVIGISTSSMKVGQSHPFSCANLKRNQAVTVVFDGVVNSPQQVEGWYGYQTILEHKTGDLKSVALSPPQECRDKVPLAQPGTCPDGSVRLTLTGTRSDAHGFYAGDILLQACETKPKSASVGNQVSCGMHGYITIKPTE